MAASTAKVDDRVHGKIFVIHPIRRRSSTHSCQTFDTEFSESNPNISIENQSDHHDMIPRANHGKIHGRDQINHGNELIDVASNDQSNSRHVIHDSPVPEQSTSTPDSVLSTPEESHGWNRIKIYISTEFNVSDTFNWTIIQTWYNMAFMQCMVPFFIRRNRESEHYEKISFRPQQVVWAISMMLLVIEMLSWVPDFLSGLEKEPNPYLYLSMTAFLTAFLLRCCFFNLVCCNAKLIIDYLNSNSKLLRILPADRRWYIRGRKITLSFFVLFSAFNITSLILSILLRSYIYAYNWGWTMEEFVHIFACYGKKVLWISDCTFDDGSAIHTDDVFYGIFGLLTYANGLLSFNTAVLCLLTSTFTLLLSAVSVRQADMVTNVEKFELLSEMSSRLSNIVGGMLTLYMIDFAISMPDWIRLAFQNHKICAANVSFRFLLLLTIVIVGCVASLYVDRIKSRLADPDGIEQLPTDLRQYIALFHKILKTSVGIGYPGLYTLNFRLLFSYMGIICSVIVVIHETIKDMNEKHLDEGVSNLQGNATLLSSNN